MAPRKLTKKQLREIAEAAIELEQDEHQRARDELAGLPARARAARAKLANRELGDAGRNIIAKLDGDTPQRNIARQNATPTARTARKQRTSAVGNSTSEGDPGRVRQPDAAPRYPTLAARDRGDRIRKARLAAGMNLADLALASGVARQTIGALERGRVEDPHAATIAAIATATGTDPVALMDGPR